MDLLTPTRKAATLAVFLPMMLLWALCIPASPAEVMGKKSFTSGDAPVVIRSNSLEIDNRKRVVSFTGSVEAKKEDMLIRCQKMLVHYKDTAQDKASEGKGFKIDRIVATGDVKIDRAEGGTATADEAVYYEDEEKIVLQGRPVVKQGEDYVEGSIITLFLREDRSVVEGGGEQKVRAVLSPRNRKK